ncbi:MAG: hypothetical protein ABF242_05365 [Flavobacteriales bacterium]
MKKLLLILGVGLLSISQYSFSQGSPDYNGGYKIKFDSTGKKYLRFISWAQVQANYSEFAAPNQNQLSFNLRRARFLMYSQITDKFLILSHFGLNSLNANNMSPIGTGDRSQLFFHDFWGQYNIAKNHTIGAGLHYFNGISRLNNQSTLNMLTLDNNRQSWSTIGLSDQFARHLGVFGKGKFGKLQYRVAINDAMTNSLDGRTPDSTGTAVFGGKRLLGSATAGFAYAGYFEYNFLDQESNFLPYKVGSYLGDKRIFNVGAGFHLHPNGAAVSDTSGAVSGENVALFAVDAFYEAPIGSNNSAITAYATVQFNDYGTDYLFSAYGTGTMFYGHVGYVLPGAKDKTRFQPYVSYGTHSYDASSDSRNTLGVGINAYMSGHHSKLTLEYQKQDFGATQSGTVRLQAMIYL